MIKLAGAGSRPQLQISRGRASNCFSLTRSQVTALDLTVELINVSQGCESPSGSWRSRRLFLFRAIFNSSDMIKIFLRLKLSVTRLLQGCKVWHSETTVTQCDLCDQSVAMASQAQKESFFTFLGFLFFVHYPILFLKVEHRAALS